MLVTFSTIFLISCILMIYGSYQVIDSFAKKVIKYAFLLQCNFLLMYPFVIADLFYIIFLATQHVFLMLYLKEQNYGLGKLILYSNLGGFLICKYINNSLIRTSNRILLVFFLYMWACVISYIKVIKLLLKGIENNNKRERRRILKQNLVKHPNQVTVSLFGIGNDEESTHD